MQQNRLKQPFTVTSATPGEHFENYKLKNMKTTNESIIASVNREAMKELLDETKETLAPEFLKEKRSNHSFSVVDLWRMQKKHKTLGSSTRW
ncbi:MAG: hypothetical protein JST02_11865 [Bacteroidetes bacterium]|nr:hypothetical protein [Bacteroidota bacterium]